MATCVTIPWPKPTDITNKMPYDRPTWDLTSVLYAVRPEGGYFGVCRPVVGSPSRTTVRRDFRRMQTALTVF